MIFLEALFGDSWQTRTLGMILIVLGILSAVVGSVFKLLELVAPGIGMFISGVGLMVARSDGASVKAHNESLEKIAQAEREGELAHHENVKEIAKVKEVVWDVQASVQHPKKR